LPVKLDALPSSGCVKLIPVKLTDGLTTCK
jgi:hypothetical protein